MSKKHFVLVSAPFKNSRTLWYLKVYELLTPRMRELCKKLDIPVVSKDDVNDDVFGVPRTKQEARKVAEKLGFKVVTTQAISWMNRKKVTNG